MLPVCPLWLVPAISQQRQQLVSIEENACHSLACVVQTCSCEGWMVRISTALTCQPTGESTLAILQSLKDNAFHLKSSLAVGVGLVW